MCLRVRAGWWPLSTFVQPDFDTSQDLGQKHCKTALNQEQVVMLALRAMYGTFSSPVFL